MRLFVCLSVLTTCFSSGFSQQAWTKPKGKFFSQIAYTYLKYNGLVDANDNVISLNRDVTNNSLQGYVEYAVTDRWMVTAIVPVVFTSSTLATTRPATEPMGGSFAGLSNIEIGGTYNFHQKNGLVLSGKLNAVLPTASYQERTGLRTGVDAFSVEPSLLIGLGKAKYFTSAELGYAYRTNQHSSRTLASFQIGKFFGQSKKLIGIFNVNLVLSNKDGKYNDGTSIFTAVYLNNLSYLAPGIKLGYKLNSKFMLWGNIRGAIPSISQQIGGNQELTPGFTLSVSYSN